MSQKEIILGLLAGQKVFRLGKFSWKWETKWEGRPSLKNPDTSALFRRALVQEIGDEMRLTTMGQIIARENTK
jgi:hypothetical protein